MADFLNLTQQLFGVLGSLGGGLQQVSSFTAAADAARGAGQFNVGMERFNSTKRLNSTARQIQKILGRQTVQGAASGFRSTSQSFLRVRSEGLGELERQIVEQKQASKLRQQMLRFQAEQQAFASEQRAAASRTSTFGQLGSNLAGLANLFD